MATRLISIIVCLTGLAALTTVGCEQPVGPVTLDVAERQADAASSDAAILHVRLIYTLQNSPVEATLERLADPNERLALAAARAAGRSTIRNDARACRKVRTALAQTLRVESRPAVLAAQVESMINLLANREPPAADASADLAALASVADRPTSPQWARELAGRFVSDCTAARPARLGANVYEGPGWKLAPASPQPARVTPPYEQRIHTVPIVAAGELRIGDCTGDSAADYLIVDNLGRNDGLQLRMTLYDHNDKQLWSLPLAGDDRPAIIPPGPLTDINGDGSAEIVFVDRGGRIVVLNGLGQLVRRSEPFRTLEGEFYFAPPAPQTADGKSEPAAGMLRLVNFRGRDGRRTAGERCDLLLTRGPNLLALNDRFAVLWHVRLDVAGRSDREMLVANLDSDDADEIVRDGVAIDDNGHVLWTWTGRPVAAAATVLGLDRPIVLLADSDGRLTGLNAHGPLWQTPPGMALGQLVVGRFRPGSPGRVAAVVYAGGDDRPVGRTFDAIGREDLAAIRSSRETRMRIGLPILFCDWNRDGIDDLWGRDQAGVAGWFNLAGDMIEAAPQAMRVVGLFDVTGDGEPELLYFQGESLVIHRR